MAEFKQYVTHVKDNGRILVSEDVISTLAINALTDIEGYAGLDVKPGADIVELIGSKSNWGKGVKVIVSEGDEVTVECNIIIYYGFSIVDVASAVQNAVSSSICSIVGLDNVNVNVNVCGFVRQ